MSTDLKPSQEPWVLMADSDPESSFGFSCFPHFTHLVIYAEDISRPGARQREQAQASGYASPKQSK